jgi:hypothetical protein
MPVAEFRITIAIDGQYLVVTLFRNGEQGDVVESQDRIKIRDLLDAID